MLFLGRAAMAQQGAHVVHLAVAGAAVAACTVDLFHDHAGLGQAQARAAVVLRDQRGHPAGLGQRVDKGFGVGAGFVDLAVVGVRKFGAERADSVADVLVAGVGAQEHGEGRGWVGVVEALQGQGVQRPRIGFGHRPRIVDQQALLQHRLLRKLRHVGSADAELRQPTFDTTAVEQPLECLDEAGGPMAGATSLPLNSDAARLNTHRCVVLWADGERRVDIREKLACNDAFVTKWTTSFGAQGLAGLVSLHPGLAPKVPTAKLEARVPSRTLKHLPQDGSTHWSSRKLANELGDVSFSAVQRVWRKHGVRPHRLERTGSVASSAMSLPVGFQVIMYTFVAGHCFVLGT